MIANKVNGNAVLLQNNNPNAAALSKTINNASPSMNTAKIASISPSIQNISQITQPVALNNTLVVSKKKKFNKIIFIINNINY